MRCFSGFIVEKQTTGIEFLFRSEKKMNEEISILHFKKKDLEYSKLFALLVEKKHQKHNSF